MDYKEGRQFIFNNCCFMVAVFLTINACTIFAALSIFKVIP